VSAEHAWVDLLDPSEAEIRRHAPAKLHPRATEELVRPAAADDLPRPTIEGHGDYVFGMLLVPVVVAAEDRVYAQEIDFVLTGSRLLTVRKTPGTDPPFDPGEIQGVCAMREHIRPGMIVLHLVDDVAEHYLDLLDVLEAEIEEVEAGLEGRDAAVVQRQVVDLRQNVIRIRRTLGPTRDAVRGIVDGRTDIEGKPLFRREVFPPEVELEFARAHDKLLRANEGLDFARELITSLRDFHQSLVANDQNRVTKTLTVIASLLLFPTFIVGIYGQNFKHMPELGWRHGYLFSWTLIGAVTLVQLGFFRWRRWI
jgi:magnesium transporter